MNEKRIDKVILASYHNMEKQKKKVESLKSNKEKFVEMRKKKRNVVEEKVKTLVEMLTKK